MRYLGGLLLQEGDATRAVGLFERALAVRRKALGDRHREVAESWHDLARGRLALRDVNGALEAVRAGIEVFRAALPDSPELANGLCFLGDVLRRHSDPREALAPLEEARAIWQKKPPSNPQDLTDVEAAIAVVRTAAR
jgi:tetratricopeptide (TPR) repeat protein